MERVGRDGADLVIAKVTELTHLVSSLVYSRKSSGRLHMCLDYKDLNTAIIILIKGSHIGGNHTQVCQCNHVFETWCPSFVLVHIIRHLTARLADISPGDSPLDWICEPRRVQQWMDDILEWCLGTTSIQMTSLCLVKPRSTMTRT